MAEQMVTIFMQYMQVDSLEDNPMDTNNSNEFHKLMNTMEKEFNRTNQFISISLMILGKKGGFPWRMYILSFVKRV
jgi:gamma-tubulin complex component 5